MFGSCWIVVVLVVHLHTNHPIIAPKVTIQTIEHSLVCFVLPSLNMIFVGNLKEINHVSLQSLLVPVQLLLVTPNLGESSA